MTDLSLTILPETADDAPAVERLHARTFGPGRFAKSAYRLREKVSHRLELSFTARVGTLLVGSVRLSPIRVGKCKALLLGPLTVEPPFRDRGIGYALIERALAEPGDINSSCWWAMMRIMPKRGSSASPRVVPSCRVQWIQTACWSANLPMGRPTKCQGRFDRTGTQHKCFGPASWLNTHRVLPGRSGFLVGRNPRP